MAEDPKRAVARFRPKAAVIEKRIRELALNSANVAWGKHTKLRMAERDVTDQMLLEVLRTGSASGEIEAGAQAGEWKVKMTKKMKGRRELGVVTVVVRNVKLFVKTVEWEDLK